MKHMRTEVLTVVKMSLLVFSVVTLYAGSMLIHNVGIYLQVHKALHPRRLAVAVQISGVQCCHRI
jgi:hypothetical protein